MYEIKCNITNLLAFVQQFNNSLTELKDLAKKTGYSLETIDKSFKAYDEDELKLMYGEKYLVARELYEECTSLYVNNFYSLLELEQLEEELGKISRAVSELRKDIDSMNDCVSDDIREVKNLVGGGI